MIPLMHLLAKLKDCSSSGVEASGRGAGVTSFKKRAPSGSESRKVKKLMGAPTGVKTCTNILIFYFFFWCKFTLLSKSRPVNIIIITLTPNIYMYIFRLLKILSISQENKTLTQYLLFIVIKNYYYLSKSFISKTLSVSSQKKIYITVYLYLLLTL